MKTFILLVILTIYGIQLNSQSLELVEDLNPGSGNGVLGHRDVAFVNGSMIFSAFNSTIGREPYAITNGEMILLKDIASGAANSNPGVFFYFNGMVYFKTTAGGNLSFWKTDGTPDGTSQAFEVPISLFESPDEVVVSRVGKFYFTPNNKLFVSDGTQEGTIEGRHIPYFAFQPNFAFASLNVDSYLDGIAYVVDADTAFHLFSALDTAVTKLGTVEGSSLDGFSVLGPFEVNDGLVLAARDASSTIGDLYLYNSQTGMLDKYSDKKIVASRINRINDDQILISTHSDGNYVTDGTTAGTQKINSTSAQPSSSLPLPFVRIGDKAFFHGGEPTGADAVYVTDGSPAGTKLVANIQGNDISGFISAGQYAFWINDHAFNGKPEVWTADINETGATKLYEHPTVFNQANYQINPIGATNDKIYFVAHLDDAIGRELYSLEHNLVITGSQIILPEVKCEVIQDKAQGLIKIILEEDNTIQSVSIYDISGKLIISLNADVGEWIELPSALNTLVVRVKTVKGEISKILTF